MNTTASSTAAGTVSLQLGFLHANQIAAQPPCWWEGVLGVVGFEKMPLIGRAHAPSTASMVGALQSADLCEVWRVADSPSPLSSGSTGAVHYRHSQDLLFGCLSIEEGAINARSESEALLRATEIAYQDIFEVLKQAGQPHLLRIWNYLPRINALADGEERYRHFNSARQMAFRKSGRATMGTVPAACALGSPEGSPICIYFLASRRPPRMIENPRQTSAYHYPPKFGRHSPIFSRACIWQGSGGGRLFISGTASIVGHETIHRGDVIAQTRETMVNIDALLKEANRIVGAARFSARDLKLKVYVRNAADFKSIEATLFGLIGSEAAVVYLNADVCREDLLVEIEAVG